jgi:hypothetical protein
LDAQLKQWQQDYKDLAHAMAKAQGYEPKLGAKEPEPEPQTFSAEPALPGNIFAAIEDTTDRDSEARKISIEWARGALDSGMKADEVEAQLRQGEEIKI